MHEMGIATEILKIVQDSIPAEMAGARVRRVNLRVGKLSAIVTESLRFCFTIVAEKTPVAGAELAVEEVAVKAKCGACGQEFTIESAVFLCPACNSGNIQMLSGRELDIVSIEVEEESKDPN
ncbi:MAG: hydrogenase maturation nickel metallochaperone HypA [Desulfobacteraceae bacterium]|nr:hydrogenase maturation nickel metallochaperone HypA [Desulfobacteraceae bacterium]